MEQPIQILNTATADVDPALLVLHPKNPRQGSISLLTALYILNGFYGRVVVDERTGFVLAGNHRVMAAVALEMPLIPVEYIETRDDDHAEAIMLSDNRASDLATNNDELLADLLEGLSENGGLEATGFDQETLDVMLADLNVEAPEDFPSYDEDIPTEHRCPSCGFVWSGATK